MIVSVAVAVAVVVRFNARENASERMAGICIERESTHVCGTYS